MLCGQRLVCLQDPRAKSYPNSICSLLEARLKRTKHEVILSAEIRVVGYNKHACIPQYMNTGMSTVLNTSLPFKSIYYYA